MKQIKLIVLDVDGTMTDGKIYIDNSGNETKSFNVKDGLAIAQAIKHNVKVAIVTGRSSKIVDIRAKELGIEEVYQNAKDKVKVINSIVNKNLIGLTEVCFIGDDINDLPVMKIVGFSACPKNAAIEVCNQANFISQHYGGEGAVREIIEMIMKEQGLWNPILEKYEGGGQ